MPVITNNPAPKLSYKERERRNIRLLRMAKLVSEWSEFKDSGGCVVFDPVTYSSVFAYDMKTSNGQRIFAETLALFTYGPKDKKGWELYTTKSPCLGVASFILEKGISRVICPPIQGVFGNEAKARQHLLDNGVIGTEILTEKFA